VTRKRSERVIAQLVEWQQREKAKAKAEVDLLHREQCARTAAELQVSSLTAKVAELTAFKEARERRRLPDTRESVTHKFVIHSGEGDIDGYVIVGLYPDGRPGEVFLRIAQQGGTVSGFADAWAIAVSLLLQTGTPLEAIIAGRYGESVHRTAPVLSIIKRSADRLLRLADGLLEFLRLDSGAVIPRPVVLDLTDFAAPYMEEFALLCEKRDIGIAFDKGRGVVARVDPALLETAYLNLLSNAAKFTQPGGSIQVRTGKTEGRVWIEVADTGPGIPPEWLPRLFERYAAASESLRSSYSGFGIGLPLAADIVRLLGGEIEVESTRGVGSEFRMSFPKSSGVPQPMAKLSSNRLAALVPATAIEAPEPDRDRAGSELPTVLVVDDDRDMTAFLVSFLSDRFAVFTAGSGDEALSFLGSGKRPRAIVADLMMPGMSGLELRRKVAAIDHLAGVPFLFLSAKSDEATRIAGLEAGAVDYLGKPFAVEELEARIASVISVGDAERARLERRVIAALRDDDRGTEVRADDWRAASKAIGLEGRDMEIAELVAAGKGDKEIAVALGYSARTVSNRVSAILKRTGSINRTALVARLHQSPRRA